MLPKRRPHGEVSPVVVNCSPRALVEEPGFRSQCGWSALHQEHGIAAAHSRRCWPWPSPSPWGDCLSKLRSGRQRGMEEIKPELRDKIHAAEPALKKGAFIIILD